MGIASDVVNVKSEDLATLGSLLLFPVIKANKIKSEFAYVFRLSVSMRKVAGKIHSVYSYT